jgi:hypothetical protein
MVCFLLIEVDIIGSWSPMLTISLYTFAHTPFIYLFKNVFHIWLDDNLHGILPLDGVMGMFGKINTKIDIYTFDHTAFIY